MAHQSLTRPLAVIAALALVACAASSPPPLPRPPAAPPGRHARPWGDLKSIRFELSIPVPDRDAWRLDDQSTSWLSATNEGTHAALLVRRWREDGIVNRETCERRARELRKLPERDGSELVEEHAIAVPPDFDTHVEVRVVPASPKEPLHAFAIAFGGSVHACFAYVYTTSAEGRDAERIVGDRLAIITERSLGAITVERPLALGENGKPLEGPPALDPPSPP